MELRTFIENFTSQFEETDSKKFQPNTNFKKLSEWSSLMALSIIAMVDEEYNIKLNGDDIRKSSTIEDLYMIVKSRM